MISARISGIIAIGFVLLSSYFIYFILQTITEEKIKNALIDAQIKRQNETTRAISFHVASDFDFVIARLALIASSIAGNLSGNIPEKLSNEQYLGSLSTLNLPIQLMLVDGNGVVRSVSPINGSVHENSNVGGQDYFVQSKSYEKPFVSVQYHNKSNASIVISYPVIEKSTGKYLGLVAANMSPYVFGSYGNIYGIQSPYVAVLDQNGTHIVHGNRALIGKNFFDSFTQNFTNHNSQLNELVRRILAGGSGYVIYSIASGERLTSGYPVYIAGRPTFFVFVVTPTESLYSQIGEILSTQKTETLLLLTLITISAGAFIFFLLVWNRRLDKAVEKRTKQLTGLNDVLSTANQRLEEHERTQKDFLNVVAHELRTPTQAILGYAEMMKMNPNLSKYLEYIVNNANRLYRLLEDILETTRIENNLLVLNKEPFYIDQLVIKIVDFYVDKLHSEGLPVNIRLGRLDQAKILADKDRVQQVFTNLIDNAIKFTPSGTIEINVNADYKVEKRVTVSVADTGTGVDMSIRLRLFQRFVSKSRKGTGLGLFISRNIVELHGGKIWFEPAANGNGSIFKFTVPLSL